MDSQEQMRQLRDALVSMLGEWKEVRALWRDGVAMDFERSYVTEVSHAVLAVVAAAEDVSEACSSAMVALE